MAKKILDNNTTFSVQRGKINDNFTELYTDKLDKTAVPSLNFNTTYFTVVSNENGFNINLTQLVIDKLNSIGNGGTAPALSASTITFGTSTVSKNIVNWSAVTNATSYVVKRSINNDMSSPTTIYTGTLLTFSDIGLTESTQYYYSITASATSYTSSISAIAGKSTLQSTGVNNSTDILNFNLQGFTQSGNSITSTTGNAKAVAKNNIDGNLSSLVLNGIEVGYDSSWAGNDVTFGLSSANYGESFNATEFSIYIPSSRALEKKTSFGTSSSSLGYTLPASTTSKLRVTAVKDTTYWKVFFSSSTDGGVNWTVLNTGGTLSSVDKNTPLYGNLFVFQAGVTYTGIKGML